jgi:hypothetical protein
MIGAPRSTISVERLMREIEDEVRRARRTRFVVFVKRRLLLPATRWLYEYSLENFRRQQRVNALLFACVEELAIENAKLRKLAELGSGRSDNLKGTGA